MKIALGTAQFGSSYGVANIGGKVKVSEITKILADAASSKVDTIDTAMSYGDSERALGLVGIQDFKIVTKLPDIPEYISDVCNWVNAEVNASLNKLGTTSVHGILVHNAKSLLGNQAQELANALERLKESGIVTNVGVSIYDPEDLGDISEILDIDIVQAPLNLVDRRLINTGWLYKLDKMNVEVHTRSSFLQGLLLLPRDKIPKKFERWSKLWDFWHNQLNKNDLDPLSQCLRYVMDISQVSRVIVGVETLAQFREIINAVNVNTFFRDWTEMTCDDHRLINPSNWDSF